jgi:hypothetical protein
MSQHHTPRQTVTDPLHSVIPKGAIIVPEMMTQVPEKRFRSTISICHVVRNNGVGDLRGRVPRRSLDVGLTQHRPLSETCLAGSSRRAGGPDGRVSAGCTTIGP